MTFSEAKAQIREIIKDHTSELRSYDNLQNAIEVYEWLHAKQFLYRYGTSGSFSFIAPLYIQEKEATIPGWTLVSHNLSYTGVVGQWKAVTVAIQPTGEEVTWRYGNNGANGMGSDYRNNGTRPPKEVELLLEIDRLKKAFESSQQSGI